MKQDGLCNRCKSIPAVTFYSSGKPRIGAEYEFGPTEPYQLFEGCNAFEELKLSAAAGCSLCKLFQDALKLSNYDPDEQLRRQPELCDSGIVLKRSTGDLEISFGTICSHKLDARLVIHTDGYTTRSIEPKSYVVETDSDSPANFALTRSWLAECCKNHEDCGGSLEFELPRRLLDVMVPSEPGIIRLCSAFDLDSEGRADYLALSHCWGSSQPLKTMKDNLQSHIQGFPDTRLPPTFYDAVRTTRELGLRYLWIDSLCIVQDDRSDFEIECARMNTIYANATCTIAASDARDCGDGLFQSRTMKPIRLNYESNGLEPKLTVIMQPTLSGRWMQGLQGPLQSRAWVLQERHLSPRIIHYTKKCLMWECRTAIASEHSQKMRLKIEDNRSIWPELSSNRFLDGGRSTLEPDTRSFDKFHNLHRHWYGAVQQYSHRHLSHPEDKLAAFAGFAAEWKRVKPNDEYLAGLWKSDVFKGLAWFPSSEQHDIGRRLPESDVAWPPSAHFEGIPSWSWAAFDGRVAHFGGDWFDDNFYDHSTGTPKEGQSLSSSRCALWLHDVTTTTVGLNPFGSVSEGEMTLSSWSIVVTLSESDFSPGHLIAVGDAPKAYRLHPDIKYVSNGMVYFDYDPFCLPKVQVRLLQLGRGRTLHGSQAYACGLALLQVQSEGLITNRELYRRVGMFELDDESFWLKRREHKVVTMI